MQVIMMLLRLHKFAMISLLSGCAAVAVSGAAAAETSASIVSVAAPAYVVAQSDEFVKVLVNRSGASAGAASVVYHTHEGTTTPGENYYGESGRLNWADGETAPKTITIYLVRNAKFSGTKKFSIELESPSGAELGAPAAATVTITGLSGPGTVAVAAPTYTVNQDEGSLHISVVRTGGAAGAASVAYHTHELTTTRGVNYYGLSGTLTWADGDTAAKPIDITILNGTPFVGTKTFMVELDDASGASLGAPANTTITINGDGTAGQLMLSAAAYSVAETGGAAIVSVKRVGGASGAASVGYATANNTAIAGSNYTATSGELTWADGDSSTKTFSIPINDATPFTGTKSLAVALASASGASLGGTKSASVVIIGVGPTTTASATVSWSAPTLNTNGTPISDLAGYNIYYGPNADQLTQVVSVSNPAASSQVLSNLAHGTWYFAVSAYNSQAAESGRSAVATATL